MMKKNILKLDVLLICAAALLASCSGIPDSRGELENPGMFTLTGIPEEFDGKLVYIDITFGMWSGGKYSPAGFFVIEKREEDYRNRLELIVVDGELKLPLYKYQGIFSQIVSGYSGADNCYILCSISTGEDYSGGIIAASHYFAVISFDSVQFENGAATVNWNDGDVKWGMKAGNRVN
jgi:hypothetical protein